MMMAPNRSKTYLLPLILQFYNLKDDLSHNFINCFIFDTDKFHENCIYLLYKYDIKNPIFTFFEYELSKTEGYVTHYDLKNNLILFVLEFPKAYLEEYNCYIEGEYSKYNNDAKRTILDYYRNRIPILIYNKIDQILYKKKELKLKIEKMLGVTLSDDSELGDIIDTDSETINIRENMINYL